MTTIQDKITYFDGSTATGKIVVTWPPFDYGGMAIAAGQQEYPIAADGTVTITCYPCVGAQPFGTYYTATYELDKGAAYDEYWLVPSASPTTIGAIRVSVPQTPSIMINATQLTSGGASSGMFLGWNGSSWVPMYPGPFNSAVQSFNTRTGSVMPQTGDYTVGQVTGAVPNTRQIIAGAGLAGGGPLTADVTISLTAGGFVPPTTQIIAGYGLTGGGALTGNVTLAVLAGMFALQTTQVIAGAGLTGGGSLSGPSVTLALSSGAFVPPTTQVIAGYGLSGGGPLSGPSVTLAVLDNGSIQKLQLALAGALKSTRHQLNFIAGSGVNLNLVDDALNDEGTLTITAVSTGAPSPSIFSVDGVQKGTQPELNLISGSNVTLVGANNSGAGRVDITVSTTGGGVVTSVFTRIGAVVALAADYAAFYVPVARQVLAGAGLSGGGVLSADVTLSASVISVFTRTGAVVALATDYAAFYVPLARQVIAGVGLGGGGALSADVTLTAKAMAASGASHSAGMVPDPGVTAGNTRYLREDATWVAPSSGSSQTPWLTTIDAASNILKNVKYIGVGNDMSVNPNGGTNPVVVIGSTTTNIVGEVTLVANNTVSGGLCGSFNFANFNIAGAEKRIAAINGFSDNNLTSGGIIFYTWNTGTAAEVMRIRYNGNVGISNSAPGTALDVGGMIRTGGGTNPTTGAGLEISYQGGQCYLTAYDRGAGAYKPVNISGGGISITGEGQPIVLQGSPAGNVGISTSVPITQLALGYLSNDTNLRTYPSQDQGGMSFYVVQNYPGTNNYYRWLDIISGGGNAGGYIRFITQNPGAAGVAAMVIGPAGNVGIGTTLPTSPLHIAQSASTTSTYIQMQSAGAVDSARLRIYGAGYTGGVGVQTAIDFIQNSASNWNSQIAFSVYGGGLVEAMRIASNGYVGIGTNAPRSPLTIIASNPTSSAYSTAQFTIGEVSNNPQWGLCLGYWQNGGNYVGMIQAVQANAGSTLQINPGGGTVNVGGLLTLGAGITSAQAGDLTLARTSAPNTAAIYFTNAPGTCYLYYDGATFNLVGGGLIISGNVQTNGIIYGGSATLNVPAHNCPVFTTNPNMPNNTYGFTVNEAGNYATFWVRFSNGTLHIFSTTLTAAP